MNSERCFISRVPKKIVLRHTLCSPCSGSFSPRLSFSQIQAFALENSPPPKLVCKVILFPKSWLEGSIGAGEDLVTVISSVPGARLTALQFKQSDLLMVYLPDSSNSLLSSQRNSPVGSGLIKDGLDRLIKMNTWKTGPCMFSWQWHWRWQYAVRRHCHYENESVWSFLTCVGRQRCDPPEFSTPIPQCPSLCQVSSASA